MNNKAKGWVAAILAAIALITPVVTSKKTGWHRPGEIYTLTVNAGDDIEATQGDWTQLNGSYSLQPNIKWIKKSKPSTR